MRFKKPLIKFKIRIIAAIAISFSANAETVDFEITRTSPDTIGNEYFTISEKPTTNPAAEDDFFSPLSVMSTLEEVQAKAATVKVDLLNWVKHDATQPEVPEKYKRVQHFGTWIKDPTKQTCFNIRMKVLERDSDGEVVLKENNKCAVAQGEWHDPYTDTVFKSAAEIQIDHFVPLKNAYVAGAWNWNYAKRCHYGNFMGNKFHLLPVAARENMRKGDRSPDAYLPPNDGYICQYLENWLKTKAIWKLKLSRDEAAAIHATITDYKCDPASFKLTRSELRKQRSIADDIPASCLK